MTWESLRFDDLEVLHFTDLIVCFFGVFDFEDLRVYYINDLRACKVDLKVFNNLKVSNSVWLVSLQFRWLKNLFKVYLRAYIVNDLRVSHVDYLRVIELTSKFVILLTWWSLGDLEVFDFDGLSIL